MFPYDPAILVAVENAPQTIPDVLQGLQTIDGLCLNEDGLRWFNALYLAVTHAVENRVNGGGFTDPAWLAQLDVQFARFTSPLSGPRLLVRPVLGAGRQCLRSATTPGSPASSLRWRE